MKVLMEVLTRKVSGISCAMAGSLIPSSRNAYSDAGRISLRESKDLAEKTEEAIPSHKALTQPYKLIARLTTCLL